MKKKQYLCSIIATEPMRKAIILIIMCAIGLKAMADSYTLNSRQVTTVDGLAGNTINELIQDEEGFIWMATNNGVSRYDGFTTVNFTSLSTDADHRMEARVGRIVKDPARRLLWLSTATYQNACYDLRRARFVDWTGRGDHYRQQNKVMMTTHGMVLYGMGTGATLCSTADGSPTAIDYRQKDGVLPSDNVLTVVEDSAHNIWLPTDKGIAVLRSPVTTHPSAITHRLSPIIATATSGRVTYFLSSDGAVSGYDTSCQAVLNSQIPSAMGRPQKVNVSFVWQGRWMLFTPEGTYAMNLKDGTFERPAQMQIVDGLSQGSCEGYHLIANRTGRLWLFPDSGSIKSLDLIPDAYYSTNKGWKFHVARAADGRLFIATYGNGLFIYNPADGHLQHYGANDESPVIHSNYLLCAMTDSQGNIWVGSESAGAYCLSTMSTAKARYLQIQPADISSWDNTISTVRNSGNTTIIGTRKGNVYAINNPSPFTTPHSPLTALKASVNAYFTDSKGRTWTGTWGDGLYIDGQRYASTDSVHHIPSDFISDIVEDNAGHIWVATWNAGLLQLTDKGFSVVESIPADMNSARINDLLPAGDNTLWAASNNGIIHLKGDKTGIYNTTNQKFPADEIRALLIDRQGMLWAACAGGGVIRSQIDANGDMASTVVITDRQGLANNSTTSLVEDAMGYIWVGTEDGISRINPKTDIVNSYRFSDTMQGNNCFNNSTATDDDGHIMFGTTYGLLIINPEAMLTAAGNSASRITDVNVNGLSIHELGLLKEAMSYTHQITLSHDQNSLRICFSDFEYNHHNNPVFQYYLDGVENTWQSVTTDNHADYSELPPGSYTFHLRSLNARGEWNDEATLDIVIRQPWWNTWWAWLVYLLLLAAAAYYVYRNWRDKFMLHQQMEMDKQLMEFRTGIFTNITHEFRTPLAIIKGAVDKLGEDAGNKAALQTAGRGTSRLLRLVNQLMEYRKISTGNLRLQVEQGDIVTFVRNIYQDFWIVAKQKDMQISFQTFDRHYDMPFDHQIVETVVYNLLSNAVKYTPERGTVTLRISNNANEPHTAADDAATGITITVEDNGPGISPEKQAELFKPFMHGYASQGGMGIGLYTAHQMAQLHKGSLTYKRTDDTTLFTLTLPADDSVYSADDYRDTGAISTNDSATATSTAASSAVGDAVADTPDIIREMQAEALNDLTVAIIEDNPDMADQIRREVGVYFNTVCYSSGEAFLDATLNTPPSSRHTPPSLILCDVMLPDIDGYEIVRRLRADENTVHLPVIMLTALDDEAHQIRAYRAGADDYMVKPCNFRLLIARIFQLIKWNRALVAPRPSTSPLHTPASTLHTPASLVEGRVDKVFKDKLQALTAKHLSDPNFNIDQLAQMMNMGRTKFYGKVKELMGMSPNKYLQEERMSRAAELLLEGELTVAEISYKVGIQDPSYFNKCFKAKYGVVPSKYGK